MVKNETKTFHGLTFQLGMLPGFQSLEAMPRVLKLVGPAAGGLKEVLGVAAGGAGKIDKGKLLAVGADLLASFGKADPAELVDLAKILLAPCRVKQGAEWVDLIPVFDVVLQGRMFTVLNLLAWAVQLNYQDFFALLPSATSAADGQGSAPAPESAPS